MRIAAHEAALGSTRDVVKLAAEQLECAEQIENHRQRIDVLLVGLANGAADLLTVGRRARNRGLLGLGARHGVVGHEHAAARSNGRVAREALGPCIINGLDGNHVALFVAHHSRARGNVEQCPRHMTQLGKRATHAVTVDDGHALGRSNLERQKGVQTARFERHNGVEFTTQALLQRVNRAYAFHTVGHLLHEHCGRAQHVRRADERIVGQFVERHHLERAIFINGLKGHELADIRVAAATRCENCGANRHILDFALANSAHDVPLSNETGCRTESHPTIHLALLYRIKAKKRPTNDRF